MHVLTFVYPDGAELDNDVTAVVNLYDLDWPIPYCCKCDKIGYYCIDEFVRNSKIG
jgi:hypothetical protein